MFAFRAKRDGGTKIKILAIIMAYASYNELKRKHPEINQIILGVKQHVAYCVVSFCLITFTAHFTSCAGHSGHVDL